MNTLSRIVTAQVVIPFGAAAGCLFVDVVASYSALLGGLTGVLPTLYAVVRFSGQQRSARGGNGLTPLLTGELGRQAFSIALFSVVFVLVEPLNVLCFFGTFVLMQMCYGIVPLIEAMRLRRRATIPLD